MSDDRCPTCGAAVRVEGRTTQYYVPVRVRLTAEDVPELTRRVASHLAALDHLRPDRPLRRHRETASRIVPSGVLEAVNAILDAKERDG